MRRRTLLRLAALVAAFCVSTLCLGARFFKEPLAPPEQRLQQRRDHATAPEPGRELQSSSALTQAAVVLLCYNRPHYLETTLTSLEAVEGAGRFPVYVSQDGDHSETARVGRRHNVTLWQHPRTPLLSREQAGHAYLAQHYKWALDRLFFERNHSHAIVLEDDMLFSPDFFSYFEQSAWLLQADPTLWCVSSWNDNGFDDLVSDSDASRVFRTDFFPGLGWMLRRELWLELSPRFPLEHWDHWMRLRSTSRGRDCVVPYVSRNYNIGVFGANMQSSQYERYLKRIRFNKRPRVKLERLESVLSDAYEHEMARLVSRASANHYTKARPSDLASKFANSGEPVLLTYTADTFAQLAIEFRIWSVPRATHKHTAVLRYRGATFVLASARWSPYLPERLKSYFPKTATFIKGATGESCNDACQRNTYKCASDLFEFANQVDRLSEFFSCERGFATVTGPDIPNYVVDPSNEYAGRCLVSEGGSQCAAVHRHTQRLCPCTARGEEKVATLE
ncbi:hypothetical protein AB1Y20_009036 [Prymnesium parvum]|uniref:alpha-1,3-mannosyl-glycoprotein 2-beta-N-acetylglucosaminyltransferase n=1 Tax=Prymnesium parvum TaxID=97485 RepID=A0AB34K4J3_PRYPA